ncbi:MAG: ParA family protein, partial [Hyphomicrobiaceae bacterium]
DVRVVAGLVAGGIAGLGSGVTVGKIFGNWALSRQLAEADQQLSELKGSLEDSVHLWLRPPRRSDDYVKVIRDSIPIITVVNLKGGVGKTTIAANLVAYFSEQRRRDGSPLKILVIDLDYQGSLSVMLLSEAEIGDVETTSNLLVDPQHSIATAKAKARRLRPRFDNVWLYAAHDDFLPDENRLMMEWITQRNPDHGDLRYELHRKLQSPGFLDDYDLVIIDGPPRMTTGFLAGLCASTHLLIPTIADRLSAPAWIRFLVQLQQLGPELFPATTQLGLVPSRTYRPDGTLTEKEKRVIDLMLADLRTRHQIFDTNVFRDAAISHTASFIEAAGSSLAYFHETDPVPRKVISQLGNEIKDRIRLKR